MLQQLRRIVGIWCDYEEMIVCLDCAEKLESGGVRIEIDAFDAFENVGRTCGRCRKDLLTPDELARAELVVIPEPECRNCGAPCIATHCSKECEVADQDEPFYCGVCGDDGHTAGYSCGVKQGLWP